MDYDDIYDPRKLNNAKIKKVALTKEDKEFVNHVLETCVEPVEFKTDEEKKIIYYTEFFSVASHSTGNSIGIFEIEKVGYIAKKETVQGDCEYYFCRSKPVLNSVVSNLIQKELK